MRLTELIQNNSEKARVSLSALIKIILIISIIYAIYLHFWRLLFIDVLLLLVLFLPYFFNKKYKIKIPSEFEFILLGFAIITFFLGSIRGIIIQTFFGLAMGFVGFATMLILYKNSKIKPSYLLIMLFAFSLSVSLGLISEMLKFYLKIFLGTELRIVDYQYSMMSLTLVAFGALIALIIGYTYMRFYKLELMDDFIQRFKKKNPNLFIEKTDSPEELLELIKKGESDKIEFKSTLRTNLYTYEKDKKIEYAVLKTITGFLNTEGGTLLIGISDSGEILGIEKDKFENTDRFLLHFNNLIKDKVGREFLPNLNFELILLENRNIMKIECKKSDKPIFLKTEKGEEFYTRLGPASIQLTGSKLIKYIQNSF
ncbi:ATP-binding protein [archaeon]|jgi:hypothetical protein|nr:ATP-binding protein [archaeon]MBT4241316.1 ATP-binding protein [archaeon]MBT4418137.1 ATP-binding protein [archaeon]